MAKQQVGEGVGVLMQEGFLADLHSITIPPVQCSFPWNNHPDSKCLKEVSDAWILARFGHLPSAAAGRGAFKADLLIKSGFDLLATLTYANGIPDRMEPIVKLMAWFFMFDNIMDDPAEMGADPVAADELLASICAVLELAPDSSQASPLVYSYFSENPIIRAMAETAQEWWGKMRQGMSASQQSRMVAKLKDYLEGNRRQIPYRVSRSLPDLDTFVHIRADAGGWQPCSVLMEYALGIDFDEETLTHPLILSLQSTAAYNVYWVNDVLSFKKEFLEGDLLNIVPILYIHQLKEKQNAAIDLEGIVREVCEMIKKRDEECLRLVAEIKASELLMGKAGMGSYLEGVNNWLGGNIYWHLVSARYGICASADMHCEPPDFFSHHNLRLRHETSAKDTLISV